jgi:hypothetical protein
MQDFFSPLQGFLNSLVYAFASVEFKQGMQKIGRRLYKLGNKDPAALPVFLRKNSLLKGKNLTEISQHEEEPLWRSDHTLN